MRGRGRSHGSGSAVHVHLVVDQSPLLQEGVDPHDGADVSREVPAAGGAGEILCKERGEALAQWSHDRCLPVGLSL